VKQAVMVKPGQIEFRDIEKPSPGEGEVLVRIRNIGVCGSDIHVYHGKHPYTSYPVVQGHEVSGEIAELGAGVMDLSVGDLVTIMPQVVCGTCYSCRHGMYHICDNLKVMGFQTAGAAQDYFLVPAKLIIKVPRGISFEQAAMIEPVSVAVHALGRPGKVSGNRVLVLGAGTIGNLVAQTARARGAKDVMITDLSDYRLEIARACGIERTVNVTREDLGKRLVEGFGPERADLILECVGAQATIEQAVSLARKGTTIVVVGVFGEKPQVDLGLVQDRELVLIGTLMYQEKDYRTAVSLIEAGKIQLEALITDRYPFGSYLEAYRHIDGARDRVMKVMIALE
jgi:L-iditol 2-dehydrogenase